MKDNWRASISQEWSKWKGLDSKQKWYYFEDYYLLWVLGIVGILLFVVIFLVTVRINNHEIVLEGSCVNVTVSEEVQTALTEDFVSLLREGEEEKLPNDAEAVLYTDVILYYELEEQDSVSYAALNRLLAQISAGELDYLLINTESFDNLQRGGFFMELSEVLSKDTLEGLRAEHLICSAIEKETGKAYEAGIFIPKLSEESDCWLVFVSSGQHLDRAERLINILNTLA